MNFVLREHPIEGEVATIKHLIDIWSRTLQISPIFPDSNFFDLGGDSLLAVNMFLEIEHATGHHLPITAIYDAPTVAELADLMKQETPEKFSPLVLLKEGGEGEPLFIVHGVGGTVIDLAALGKAIQSDGPVYAIQARGIDGQDAPLKSIEEMADYYVEAVREVSNGPYRLAGYSFGGVVAVEMARRLRPENVEKLILLDAFAHPQTWPSRCRKQVAVARLARQLRDKVKQPPGNMLRSAFGRARKIVQRRGRKQSEAERIADLHSWLGAINPDLPLPLREARTAGNIALAAYWPTYYSGKITFLRASTTSDIFPSNARRVWEHQVQEMELHNIEGSHKSIVAEHAASTAAVVSGCLASKPAAARQPSATDLTAGITQLWAQIQ